LLVAAALNAASGSSVGWCRAPEVHEYKGTGPGQVEYYTTPRRPPIDGGSFFSQRYVFFGFHTFYLQGEIARRRSPAPLKSPWLR
jgi:hypothetical protein